MFLKLYDHFIAMEDGVTEKLFAKFKKKCCFQNFNFQVYLFYHGVYFTINLYPFLCPLFFLDSDENYFYYLYVIIFYFLSYFLLD